MLPTDTDADIARAEAYVEADIAAVQQAERELLALRWRLEGSRKMLAAARKTKRLMADLEALRRG